MRGLFSLLPLDVSFFFADDTQSDQLGPTSFVSLATSPFTARRSFTDFFFLFLLLEDQGIIDPLPPPPPFSVGKGIILNPPPFPSDARPSASSTTDEFRPTSFFPTTNDETHRFFLPPSAKKISLPFYPAFPLGKQHSTPPPFFPVSSPPPREAHFLSSFPPTEKERNPPLYSPFFPHKQQGNETPSFSLPPPLRVEKRDEGTFPLLPFPDTQFFCLFSIKAYKSATLFSFPPL